MKDADRLTVALAQLAPVWLDRDATLAKMVDAAGAAADRGADLVVYGEGLLPGYPFWLELTDGARFNSAVPKEIHSRYLHQAVVIERGDLEPLAAVCRERRIAAYAGVIERPGDRGGHSVYASLVYLGKDGRIGSVHRKLMPTYDERLTWAPGDGHGLRTHRLGAFTAGGLNCWENWMPLPRAAFYALGEDLHVAVWPGSVRNTTDITRFLALEGRSYVVSVSGVMRRSDFPTGTPHRDRILRDCPDVLVDGGSCVAAPDGTWLIEPAAAGEDVLVAELDHAMVRAERQNFDPAGHYSRPDVARLTVDRRRQSTVEWVGGES